MSHEIASRNDASIRPRYVLIDSHTLSREGLSSLLAETFAGADIDEMGCVRSLDADPARDAAALTLVVIRPGAKSAKDCLAELSDTRLFQSGGPVVVLSDRWEMAAVKQALSFGARGCISLSVNFKVVAAALRLVIEGGTYVPPEILVADAGANGSILLQPDPDARAAFTPQERRVLSALLEGKSNKRIARDLDLCESTVKVHVRHIMRKMSVTNRTQVALSLMRDGRGRAPGSVTPEHASV